MLEIDSTFANVSSADACPKNLNTVQLYKGAALLGLGPTLHSREVRDLLLYCGMCAAVNLLKGAKEFWIDTLPASNHSGTLRTCAFVKICSKMVMSEPVHCTVCVA